MKDTIGAKIHEKLKSLGIESRDQRDLLSGKVRELYSRTGGKLEAAVLRVVQNEEQGNRRGARYHGSHVKPRGY